MSLRTITKEQFSDGTTIDGNRIEQAMQELEEICDQVPGYYVKRRFVQNQITVGFSPFQQAPYNATYPATSPVVLETLNLERFKGYKNITQPVGDLLDQLFWETSFQSEKPFILHSVDCFMIQDDGSATPSHQMPGGSSSPYAAATVSDVQLFVMVDAPFMPEDRSQTDVLIHKYAMNMDAWKMTAIPGVTSTNDMVPAFPGGEACGWGLTLDNLNLPIPSLSRVRVALCIPKYNPVGPTPGYAKWGATPWNTFSPSLTLSILEPLSNV